ncbi:hypothetical protein M9Y10_016634 [Tritrichomonas musculus]|uniref:C2 domain-containing protein n=1 Tax=Tritrichomonas musculus TaxID=1915356 RepID=A0ABR2GM52_9EUKA
MAAKILFKVIDATMKTDCEIFVSVYLKSQGISQSKRTDIVNNSSNYTFNKEFDFQSQNIRNDAICISVFDHEVVGDKQLCNHDESTAELLTESTKNFSVDLFRKKKRIGSVKFEMQAAVTESDPNTIEEAKDVASPPSKKMIIFKVKICEAHKLRKIAKNAICDPSVAIRMKSQDFEQTSETDVAETTRDPVWNEEFELPCEFPKYDSLLISLHDNSEIGGDLCDDIEIPASHFVVDGPVEVLNERLIYHGKPAGMLKLEVQAITKE